MNKYDNEKIVNEIQTQIQVLEKENECLKKELNRQSVNLSTALRYQSNN